MIQKISEGFSYTLNFNSIRSVWHGNFIITTMQPSFPHPCYDYALPRRWLFFIILQCNTIFLLAQGPQQLVTVPIGTGASAKGWLYLPADYSTSTKSYPVVFFYHGAGEAGTNPYLLLNQGLPSLIANGMRPDNITNPADGVSYSFIVLSVQHWSWSPDPEWLPLELEWLRQRYRVDTNRIYVTGLSSGGQESFKAAITKPLLSRLIAAAAPMSPPAMGNYDISLIRTYRIKTWFFSGNTDPITPTVQGYSVSCNNVSPGSSKYFVFPGGHCCWNTYYNTSWHEPSSGLSLWQWLLTCKKEPPLILRFTDFKVTDLGNKKIKVEFNCENPNVNVKFYIRIHLRGMLRNIEVLPADQTGTYSYTKIITLD